MRWIVRLFLLAVLGLGLLLAVAYPLDTDHWTPREIGSWRVYEPETGFEHLVEMPIAPHDGPIRLIVEMDAAGFEPREDVSAVSLVVWADGNLIVAAPLYFAGTATPEGAATYRETAGTLDRIDAERYRAAILPGEAEGLDIRTVDVRLETIPPEYNSDVPLIGHILSAVGLIGLMWSFRRRRANGSPSQRWGRG